MGKWDENKHRVVKGHFVSQEENLLTVEAKIQEKVVIREERDIFLTLFEHLSIVSLKVHLLTLCVNKSHLYLICQTAPTCSHSLAVQHKPPETLYADFIHNDSPTPWGRA